MDIKSLLVGEAIAGGGDTPTGKIEITTTSEVNVASYAKAQVVDADLIAGNIKKDVDILGITGTYEPTPIQPSLTDLEATTNGTYTHSGYDGYDEVVVNVANSYSAGDEGKVVNNGALVSQTSTTKNANGTYDTTLNNSITVAVPQPSGNINITDTSSTNVSAYATAQVVDADLVAGNIKKDVNILGVVGTYEGGGASSTFEMPTDCDYFDYRGVLNDFLLDNIDTLSCSEYTNGHNFNSAFAYTSGYNGRAQTTTPISDWSFLTIKNDYSDNTPVPISCSSMYAYNHTLTKPLNLSGKFSLMSLDNMFLNCDALVRLPANYFANCSAYSGNTYPLNNMFMNCYALRELPDLSFFQGHQQSGSASFFYRGFGNCYCLDEVVNIPVPDNFNRNNNYEGTLYRIKEFTFNTNNGTPYTIYQNNEFKIYATHWGYADDWSYFDYGSVPYAKRVSDLASYNTLKDDPDWWTTDITFSRYNHDSAVNTINSLPTHSGTGTCTIVFNGSMGSGYGKAISDLTNAEIAVATAKNWTVTIQ